MSIEMREYQKPVTEDSTPLRSLTIEDPAVFKQVKRSLGGVTTTALGTIQGTEIYAYKQGDNVNQHIDPRHSGKLRFDCHHTEIIVEKK